MIVSKGLGAKLLTAAGSNVNFFKKMKSAGRLLMFPNNAPGYWGDIHYEKDIGWYVKATEWGER